MSLKDFKILKKLGMYYLILLIDKLTKTAFIYRGRILFIGIPGEESIRWLRVCSQVGKDGGSLR